MSCSKKVIILFFIAVILSFFIIGCQTQTPSASYQNKTESMYRYAANKLNVEVAAIKAVSEVESSGGGFLKSGFPKVLFEPSVFSNLTKGIYDKMYPNISHPLYYKNGSRIITYLEGEDEVTKRLNIAASLDKKAAYESTSWGMFQILGMNYRACGFDDVFSFVNAMKQNESEQFYAFVNFISYNPTLLRALRNKDWNTFARIYNGEEYYIYTDYENRIRKAYENEKR